MILQVQCKLCLRTFNIEMTESQYTEFMEGNKPIQRIFPEKSAAERELLISRTCGDCFNDLFPDNEEDY